MRSIENTLPATLDSTAAWYPVPVPTSSTFSPPRNSSNSIMCATIAGCEMVWFAPIGSAPGPYALLATTGDTNRWRGTSRIACRIRGSVTPRAATCRSTISARWCAKSASFGDFAKKLLERLQSRNRIVVRQIEMQRRDRNVAVLDGLEVGAFAGMPRRWIAADPVVLPTARIEPLDDSLGIDTLS